MFALEVEIFGAEQIRARLDRLREPGQEELADAIGRACASLTREHLYRLGDERHRPGVAHNFYARAADAVTYETGTSGAVEIRIAQEGIAQRYYGGTIEAVNTSHLWIPVDPESQGRTPGEFGGLIAIVNPLTNRGVGLRTEDQKVLFALVKSVDQEPDPSVLPPPEGVDSYAAAAEHAIDLLFETLREQQQEIRV